MRRHLAARLVQSLIVVFIVTTISFFVIRSAPGDPFSYDSPRHHARDARTLARTVRLRPAAAEQYVRYVASVAHGQFGYSFQKHEPVSTVLAASGPAHAAARRPRARR